MRKKLSGRLIMTIISSLMEQTAIVFIVFYALPMTGIQMPLWGSIIMLVFLMIGWGAWSIISYRKGSLALRREPLVGLPGMIGSRGEVVRPLTPEGMVKIRGELWTAQSVNGNVSTGREVTVVGQDRLKLVVRQGD